MKKILTSVIAGTLAFSFALPVFAQGTNAGGVNGGGATSTSTCVPLSNFKVTAGYRPKGGNIGAVWTTFTAKSCNGNPVFAKLRETNMSTGVMEFSYDYYFMSFSGTIDNDSVPLMTTYQVQLDVVDAITGEVLVSQSATTTTPKPKAGTVL